MFLETIYNLIILKLMLVAKLYNQFLNYGDSACKHKDYCLRRNNPDLQLPLEALDMWKNDQLFKPFFHNVGMVSQ